MHSKYIFGVFFLCFLTATVLKGQEIALKKTSVSDDIRVSLPELFAPMTEQDIQAKYVSYRPPIALYTNPNRTVDFGVNLSVTHWAPGDLALLQEFYESSIRTLYDTVNFIKKDIATVDDISFAVFEFTSTVFGKENAINTTPPISKYTLIYYAIVNNKTILFNFTCPAKDQEDWQEIAHAIMHSIKIKKTL